MHQGTLILALDLATVCGFCVGKVGEKPRFGTWRLKTADDDPARAARNLGCNLRDLFAVEQPDVVVIEAPMSAGAMLNKGNASYTADFMWRLVGSVDAVAGCYGIRKVEANVQRVRKAVLGTARPQDPKLAVKRHLKTLGFEVHDHNAADAIALFLWQAGYQYGALDLSGAQP